MSTIKKLKAEITELDKLRRQRERACHKLNMITIEQCRQMRLMAQEIAEFCREDCSVETVLEEYGVINLDVP